MVEKCIYYKMCRIINHHGYCYVEKGCECDHYLKEAVKTPTNISRDVILSELNSALGDMLTKNNDTAADTINRLMIKLTPVD